MTHKLAILGNVKMIGVDVGSAEGLQPHWRAYDGVVDFYLFEPHKESYEKLKTLFAESCYADRYHVMPIGLSEVGGQRTLYKLNCPTGSSLYPVNKACDYVDPANTYIYPIEEVVIETESLANVLDRENVGAVDIIKLDVQGAELEILKGLGRQRLDRLLMVEAEVNISSGLTNNIGPYDAAPTWSEIDEVMDVAGMRLVDVSVARIYRPKHGDSDWYQREVFDVYENCSSLAARVWEADVVYVRDWQQLVSERDDSALRKLIVALCGYRFFSEAYFTLEKAEEAGIFCASELEEIRTAIIAWHNYWRRPWHGRGAFWRLFRRILRTTGISQYLRWKQYMWFEYPNG